MAQAPAFDPRHPLQSLARAQDPLRPPSADNRRLGVTLSLLAHGGLVGALALGVQWRTSEPQGVSAELWAAVPQVAAPPAEAPAEPTPQPSAPPPPQPQAEPEAAQREAEIALEKARQRKQREQEEQREKERQKRLEQERQQELERQREKEREKNREKDRLKREQQRQEQAAAAAREKARQDQLRRMSEQLGGSGAPGSTGTAERSAGPSATYAGRLAALIRPNVNHPVLLPGNPTTEVTVTLSASGSILGVRVKRSSGSPEWDDAVVRGITRTAILPRDENGRLYSPMTVSISQN